MPTVTHRLAATLALLLPTAALAGADLVVFPEGYAESFVRYTTIDKPDRKIVRYMYVNPETAAAATPDAELPYGTVLVMEDHKAVLEGETLVTDANGRLVPTDEVTNIFVMAKAPGWGADYPEAVRNGEWEYARFLPDGSVKADATYDGCFECHKPQAAEDFTFSFYPHLRQ